MCNVIIFVILSFTASVTAVTFNNVNGLVYSNNGGAFINVTSTCGGEGCRTCINNRCYNRMYNRVTTIENAQRCPVAGCESSECKEMVWNDRDDCPICNCDGFSTREPCASNSECLLPSGNCVDNLCRYPPVREGLPKVCVFAHECPETENCIKAKCLQDPLNRRHVLNQSCVFDHQCPSRYQCQGMTCWQGGAEHRGSCVFDNQCPPQYSCQGMTCYFTGLPHRPGPGSVPSGAPRIPPASIRPVPRTPSFPTNGFPSQGGQTFCVFAHECAESENCIDGACKQNPGNRRHVAYRACIFDYECPNGYKCDQMTCWEGGRQRTNDSCTFDHQCPTKYSCENMMCYYTGKEHGTTECIFDNECTNGQQCIKMTCQ